MGFAWLLVISGPYFSIRINRSLSSEALGERSEERWWHAELYRLRGAFFTAIGGDETQIEASFCAAIKIAREQKSVSLEKRAGGTYAEYRAQKAGASAARISVSLFSG
jgi:hypothetical protein